MSNNNLNPKILNKISEKSNGKNVRIFLQKLLIWEADKSSSNWRWKQKYNEIMEECSEIKGE
jgi:hypothetical protein